MKKIALLLAALLVLGMLAACNAEEEKVPAQVISGYNINIYSEGWKVVEETNYDMELVKDGVTMSMIGFTSMDFVDVPPAEDLYVDANEDMLEDKSVVVTVEPETRYEKNGHRYISTLFAAKDGETNMQYYCFMVEFDDEAGSMAWICFSATTEVMQKQKAELKKIVEAMDANGEYKSPEELEAELEEAMGDEFYAPDGELTDEEMGYVGEDFPVTTLPVEEETKPAEGEETEETNPAEGEGTEETNPAEDEEVEESKPAEGEAVEETVAGETTPAAEPTEAATEATE